MESHATHLKRKLILVVALASSLAGLSAYAASDAVKKLAYWETKANALANRSDAEIVLEHFEIPADLVDADFTRSLPENIRNALVFEKDGKQYIRWIINPEDTKWYKEVATFLTSKGVSAEHHKYFKAHYTASRSMLVEDPKNGAQFSAKVSTNKTGGNWTDKQQTISDAKQIRAIDDYARGIEERVGGFEHFVVMDEPATLGLKGIDQGMVVRMLNDLPANEHYYLPGFSAVHEKVGREIALKNGSINPARFWNEHYNKPLARAMAELNAYTGLSYSSPHSQNFMIELDKDMKPTGRIVFRDLGDSNIRTKFIKNAGHDEIVEIWDRTHHKATVHAKVGILKGNEAPSWLPDSVYEKEWGKDFYAEYEKTFSKIAGVPVEEMSKTALSVSDRDYFTKKYDTKSKSWNRFFSIAKCLAPNRPVKLKTGERCADVLGTAKAGAKSVVKDAAVADASKAEGPKLNLERKAADVWNDLQESSLTRKPLPIGVSGSPEVVTYGGEKEGSSSILTRVMGPKKESFATFVAKLPDEKRVEFLRDFLAGWVDGRYRADEVRDASGMIVKADLEGLKGFDFAKLGDAELKGIFALWLEKHGDRALSFVRSPVRREIFNGKFAGLSKDTSLGKFAKSSDSFHSWVPLYGAPEKYLMDAHATSVGWELNFVPQKTYAEFEEMVDWFRDALSTGVNRFEAPGHQWMVYPKRADTPEKAAALEMKLQELYKNTQAYIVLKGIQGGSGMEFANYKDVHSDQVFAKGHNTGRGVIRLENNRFQAGSEAAYNLELRSGTKSDKTRRFVQQVISARYAANEFDDLANIGDWKLVPGSGGVTTQQLRDRFGVSRLEAERALKILKGAKIRKGGYDRTINEKYWVPFWQWENAPYVSGAKREHLRSLTRSFIKTLASWETAAVDEVQNAMASWIGASNLTADIENYLKPKFTTGRDLANLHEFHPQRSGPPPVLDVNTIDLGIEYSGRFPIKYRANFSEEPVLGDKKAWLSNKFDYTMDERRALIKKVGEDLGKQLNGTTVVAKDLSEGGHGHSLVIAYEVRDPKGRAWRVEWDGVGRDYDPFGDVLVESGRGGHLELVTPKFTPTGEEMAAVFKAFEGNSLVPSIRAGGGHINIDLAAFKGRPKEMARFISQFLENRGTLAMMFQHIGRLKSAEPLEISPRLAEALKNFNGTEEELKQLLYNERFFNTRLGRKARYSQLDISAYFQDVIPTEFITEDFDLKNDIWRKSFNVDPRIRKAEFRLFNAPRTLAESELQIKLVRAMLDKAINDDAPLSGFVQSVDFKAMAEHPEQSLKEFEKFITELKLDSREYRAYFLDGIASAREAMGSRFFEPLEKKLAEHPKQPDWGKAVAARSESEAVTSAGRKWDGTKVSSEALAADAQRKLFNQRGYELRQEMAANSSAMRRLNRSLDKMDLSRLISSDDLKKMSTSEGLMVLNQKRGLSAEQYGEWLAELSARGDFTGQIQDAMWKLRPEASSRYAQWLLSISPTDKDGLTIIDRALGSEDPVVRKKAYELLSVFDDGVFIKTLRTDISERSTSVKKDLVDALNRRTWGALSSEQESELVKVIKGVVVKQSSPEVRIAASKLLSRLKNKAADELLKEVLAMDLQARDKRAALLAIGDRVGSEPAEIILKAMSDPDPVVAEKAKVAWKRLNARAAEMASADVAKVSENDRIFVVASKVTQRKQVKAALKGLEGLAPDQFLGVYRKFANFPESGKLRQFMVDRVYEGATDGHGFKGLHQFLLDPEPKISERALHFTKGIEDLSERYEVFFEAIRTTQDENALARVLSGMSSKEIGSLSSLAESENGSAAWTQLFADLPNVQSDALRSEIIRVASAMSTPAWTTPKSVLGLGKMESPSARAAVISLVGERQDAVALMAIGAGLQDSESAVRNAAERAVKDLSERLLKMKPDQIAKMSTDQLVSLSYRFSNERRVQELLKSVLEAKPALSEAVERFVTTALVAEEAQLTGESSRALKWTLENYPDRLATRTNLFARVANSKEPEVRTLAYEKLKSLSSAEAREKICVHLASSLYTDRNPEQGRDFLRFMQTVDWGEVSADARRDLSAYMMHFRSPENNELAQAARARIPTPEAVGATAAEARCAIRNILGLAAEAAQ